MNTDAELNAGFAEFRARGKRFGKNAVSHPAALAEIEALMRAKRDTSEGDRLDVLATPVQAHEDQHRYTFAIP